MIQICAAVMILDEVYMQNCLEVATNETVGMEEVSEETGNDSSFRPIPFAHFKALNGTDRSDHSVAEVVDSPLNNTIEVTPSPMNLSMSANSSLLDNLLDIPEMWANCMLQTCIPSYWRG